MHLPILNRLCNIIIQRFGGGMAPCPPPPSRSAPGINEHYNLKYGSHCAIIASKANARAKLILKSFLSRNPITMSRAFIIYVCPFLDYCSPV